MNMSPNSPNMMPQCTTATTMIKVTLESETRTIAISEPTYAQLDTHVAALFGLKQGFKLRYVDAENDEITIATDEELTYALSAFPQGLRLAVWNHRHQGHGKRTRRHGKKDHFEADPIQVEQLLSVAATEGLTFMEGPKSAKRSAKLLARFDGDLQACVAHLRAKQAKRSAKFSAKLAGLDDDTKALLATLEAHDPAKVKKTLRLLKEFNNDPDAVLQVLHHKRAAKAAKQAKKEAKRSIKKARKEAKKETKDSIKRACKEAKNRQHRTEPCTAMETSPELVATA